MEIALFSGLAGHGPRTNLFDCGEARLPVSSLDSISWLGIQNEVTGDSLVCVVKSNGLCTVRNGPLPTKSNLWLIEYESPVPESNVLRHEGTPVPLASGMDSTFVFFTSSVVYLLYLL